MAAVRGSGIGPRTLLRTIGRLALFLGLGFAAGLFFGVVTEEPGLLAGHLQGETESYALAAGSSPADIQEKASRAAASGTSDAGSSASSMPLASALRGEAEREGRAAPIDSSAAARIQSERLALKDPPSSVRPRVPAKPTRALPVVAASARDRSVSDDAWSIQVGAFADRKAADALLQELELKSYPVDLVPSEDGARRWRVRVQPIEGRSEAESVADQLKQEERLPTWLIRYPASAQ